MRINVGKFLTHIGGIWIGVVLENSTENQQTAKCDARTTDSKRRTAQQTADGTAADSRPEDGRRQIYLLNQQELLLRHSCIVMPIFSLKWRRRKDFDR